MQKKKNKKYTSRYMLKMSEKELLIYLYAFLKKYLRKKVSVQKYLDESYLLHHGPYFWCIYFTRIKNI